MAGVREYKRDEGMVEEYRMRGTMMYRKREKKRKGTMNI